MILDQLLDPFALCLDAESARRITEFRVAPPVELRVNEFGRARANEGSLTDDERAEPSMKR